MLKIVLILYYILKLYIYSILKAGRILLIAKSNFFEKIIFLNSFFVSNYYLENIFFSANLFLNEKSVLNLQYKYIGINIKFDLLLKAFNKRKI